MKNEAKKTAARHCRLLRRRRRSGGIDPQARLRAGVEGLGRGADGVKENEILYE